MPDLKKIRQTMIEEGIPQNIIENIDFKEVGGNNPLPVIHAINQIDDNLTEMQCLSIMEKQGCCKSGQRDKDCKKFGEQNKNIPLKDKIKLISSINNMGNPKLEDDGTISTGIFWHEKGVFHCACPSIKKLKKPVLISSTYCGCCAGHFLYHYQNALRIKLKLKQIKSSPLTTGGLKPCEFIFQVVEN